MKVLAWDRAQPVFGLDSRQWRLDVAGRIICWMAYGDRSHAYGWELGHIAARIEGGSDDWFNIQAEHWITNLSKEADRKQRERLPEPSTLFGGNREVQQMLNTYLPNFQ